MIDGEVNMVALASAVIHAGPLAARAAALVVDSPEAEAAAGELLEEAVRFQREIEASYGPIRKAAHEAWRRTCEEAKERAEPFVAAERVIKAKLREWKAELDRRAEAAQAEADRAAKAAAEAERLAEAEALEADGASRAEVDAALAAPVVPTPVVVEVPKLTAAPVAAVRRVARWRVSDEMALPREYLKPDESKIAGVVRSLKLHTRIPGVQVWMEDEIAVRRK
jgi:hypothetical protein